MMHFSDMIKNTRGENNNFLLMAGPCVIENRKITFETAETLKRITGKLGIPFVFKSSYRKANRSRLDSFTGIGDLEGLKILKEVSTSLEIPVVTDIHSAEEAAMAAPYADVLQIPAFLCRQTDILVAAAKTGKVVNIKKG
ncbi:MAG: 3-deoxy-8-phosphooctulonate synthase, partial [Bacteroidota bacterium]